jgi:hypothetical protein
MFGSLPNAPQHRRHAFAEQNLDSSHTFLGTVPSNATQFSRRACGGRFELNATLTGVGLVERWVVRFAICVGVPSRFLTIF